jgi:hypothetical protein
LNPARVQNRIAGLLAIAAGLSWLAWAVLNTLTSHRLEHAAGGTPAAIANNLLTAGWNFLLLPAAVRLHLRFRRPGDSILLVATAAGMLSVALWGASGLIGTSRSLETTYLALASVWLLVLGLRAVRTSRSFGVFTLTVAAFTALDAAFNLFEPVPFAVYLLAAPKLPLGAVWSLVTGVSLIRSAGDPRD